MKKIIRIPLILLLAAICSASCGRPVRGPDKTLAGAAVGAAWGAGAGAIVGNQVDNTGVGAAVGAGFGAVNGMTNGMALDSIEPSIIRSERSLKAIEVQNMANGHELAMLQDKLDEALMDDSAGGVYQVYFDTDQTSLRSGAIANLEVIADSLRTSPRAFRINVIGHSDDDGDSEYNTKLAEARARNVAAYLAGRGISSDQISVKNFGSTRPIASNSTETGRQLNRRVDIYISRKD